MKSFVRITAWFLLALGVGRIAPAADPVTPITTVDRFHVATGGAGLYRPGKWGVINVSLGNSLDRDIQLLATTHFADDPTLQFGRRMWLPPHSRLTLWHPLKMPDIDPQKEKFFELRTQALNLTDGNETSAVNEQGSQQFEQAFHIAKNEPVTALVGGPSGARKNNAVQADVIDFVETTRYDRRLCHNFTLLAEPLAPAGEELLDAVDHLVVVGDQLQNDAAGIGAIRRWVTGGGRLWIMADMISSELLESLLGDECSATEVDRVGLTTVNLTSAPGAIGSRDFTREVEHPVNFVRMIVNDVRTDFVVAGWPAAFWKRYGQGLVLVTTLGGDGWLRPRTSLDPVAPGGSSYQTRFTPSPPLTDLSIEFFTPRPEPAISNPTAEENVRQLIGYSIPSRSLVLGTLLGFTALLMLIGWRLARRTQLERLAFVLPILATIAAGMLLLAGWKCRSTVPNATAVVQLVQAVPGTDDIRTSGLAGVFSTEAHTVPLSCERGGWIVPEMAGLEGAARRMVWTDIDHWSWEKIPSPPGLRMVLFQTAGTADVPLSAVGRLEPQGITGYVFLPAGLHPTDAIIATSRGRVGLNIRKDGAFTAGNQVLGADQYVSAAVLTDEQQRRNSLLARMLEPQPGTDNPPVPTLFAWTNAWKTGMSLTREMYTTGSAVVAIPIHWHRPSEPHTPLSIPAPLLPFREVLGPDGVHPGALYDTRSGKWAERTGSTRGWLAFEPPRNLLPLNVKSATVTFKVQGPMDRLEVSAMDDGRLRSIQIWKTPVGTVSVEITDPRLLKLDDHGKLLLRLDVGPKPDDPNAASNDKALASSAIGTRDPVSYWQFEDITLDLKAEIPAHDAVPSHASAAVH